MANCNMCGRKYGLLGGGSEDVTGKQTSVCNECGALLNKAKDSFEKADEVAFSSYISQIKEVSNTENMQLYVDYVNSLEKSFENKAKEINSLRESKKKDLEEYLRDKYRNCPACGAILNKDTHGCSCGYASNKLSVSTEEKKAILKNKDYLIQSNPFYEYAVEIMKDSSVIGELKSYELENMIMTYALNGWRVSQAFSREIGKNAALGINATINETVVIFERRIK